MIKNQAVLLLVLVKWSLLLILESIHLSQIRDRPFSLRNSLIYKSTHMTQSLFTSG